MPISVRPSAWWSAPGSPMLWWARVITEMPGATCGVVLSCALMWPATVQSLFQNEVNLMSNSISRRLFGTLAAGAVFAAAPDQASADDKSKTDPAPAPGGPVETPFKRDYTPPEFKPSWKKLQINRLLVQDFVIYAHSDLAMTEKLLEKEPALLNATMDWGGGDWETGLGGASHMGRRDIVGFLLERGARIDIFCAAMMGQIEAVKSFLTLQPKLIDAKGPHGFTLHFHAQVGGKEAEHVLEYLQSIKKIELKAVPFLKKPADTPAKKPE
jgi:hypothetical protein